MPFLRSLKANGSLEQNRFGWIVQLDALIEERSYMKKIFQELGLADRLIVFEDGNSTIEYFVNLIETLCESVDEKQELENHQPVPLLLLDVNLPGSNSLNIANQVKEIFKNLQKTKQYSSV